MARPRVETVVNLAALGIGAIALAQELRKPAGARTWEGKVAGVVPYDYRTPTPARARQRMWAPSDPALFTPTVWGIGWSLNWGRAARLAAELLSSWRSSGASRR